MFTRLFAASHKYGRVLGCDYSESMLLEARRRLSQQQRQQQEDPRGGRLLLFQEQSSSSSSPSSLSSNKNRSSSSSSRQPSTKRKQQHTTSTRTRVDLVRLDVGQIPMQDSSVDCLHAGAAMHCWPDLDAAISEIHRVLQPGGRYFATTFLSDFWKTLHAAEGGSTGPNTQAFQLFESVESLEALLERGGFSKERIQIEILEPSCVVIRAEKDPWSYYNYYY